MAAFIMLLHNFIPHTHESELNKTQHEQIHQTKGASTIDILSLIFHEFTEEGEMEDILVKDNTQINFSVVFIASLTINNFTNVVLPEEKESKQHIIPLDKRYQDSGFSTAWSVRPPPFA
ncbi:MAG: hypothetical protein P1U44_14350 [Vicingaceae bacterium]|nr:hypothetical protein [Vicingaceae bacterium]